MPVPETFALKEGQTKDLDRAIRWGAQAARQAAAWDYYEERRSPALGSAHLRSEQSCLCRRRSRPALPLLFSSPLTRPEVPAVKTTPFGYPAVSALQDALRRSSLRSGRSSTSSLKKLGRSSFRSGRSSTNSLKKLGHSSMPSNAVKNPWEPSAPAANSAKGPDVPTFKTEGSRVAEDLERGQQYFNQNMLRDACSLTSVAPKRSRHR